MSVTDEPLNIVFGPEPGETTAARLMVPAKPFRLIRDIVDRAEEPFEIVIVEGFAAILKSPTTTGMMLTFTVA